MISLFKKQVGSLHSLKVINSPDRNSCVDFFRAIAIIAVVLFHYNTFLPYGFLGVDLFFLISGLLVGGLLMKQIQRKEQINFFKFFLQRGFKIWPSYYVFLLVGTLVAYLFYHDIAPDQIIRRQDFLPYVLFYQNYSSVPFTWSFGHIWSLCVEEHFYILLPVMLMMIQRFFLNQRLFVFIGVFLLIVFGVMMKEIILLYTNSKITLTGTLTRIDSLAWGVLLNLIIVYYPGALKKKYSYLLSVAGGILAGILIFIYASANSEFYEKVIFHSVMPVSFFLLIAGLYYTDFSRFKVLRFIAYYSYNWYLWHLVFVIFLTHYIGANIIGLLVYILVSFATAMFFTIMVEQPFLKWRSRVLNLIFKPTHSKQLG